METELLKAAASQGIWASLSIALIFYIIKAQDKRDEKQDERETNYQAIILKLTDSLKILDSIQEDIGNIKNQIK